jgi:NADH-quinone oxidoreductase subunit E
MRINRLLQKNNGTAGDAVDHSLIDSLIMKNKGKKGNLIPLLQGAQDIYGYIPKPVFEKLSL